MQRFLLAAALIALCSAASAQSSRKVEAAVRAAAEALRLAMISGDSTALHRITRAELSYGHSSGAIDTKATFIRKLVSRASDFTSIQISDEEISVVKNTAIIRHRLRAETADGGKAGSVDLRVVLVWVRGRDGWKLLARQAVKNPD